MKEKEENEWMNEWNLSVSKKKRSALQVDYCWLNVGLVIFFTRNKNWE